MSTSLRLFRDGPIDGVVVQPVRRFEDARGWLVELFREDELGSEDRPLMAYVSQTLPGVARGPHEHRGQTDCFVFLGPGDFKLYLWDARPDRPTCGNKWSLVAGESNPQRVLVPPGVVHAYQNISQAAGWVFNCPNQLYAGQDRKGPVDEIRYEDLPNSPFLLE